MLVQSSLKDEMELPTLKAHIPTDESEADKPEDIAEGEQVYIYSFKALHTFFLKEARNEKTDNYETCSIKRASKEKHAGAEIEVSLVQVL